MTFYESLKNIYVSAFSFIDEMINPVECGLCEKPIRSSWMYFVPSNVEVYHSSGLCGERIEVGGAPVYGTTDIEILGNAMAMSLLKIPRKDAKKKLQKAREMKSNLELTVEQA